MWLFCNTLKSINTVKQNRLLEFPALLFTVTAQLFMELVLHMPAFTFSSGALCTGSWKPRGGAATHGITLQSACKIFFILLNSGKCVIVTEQFCVCAYVSSGIRATSALLWSLVEWTVMDLTCIAFTPMVPLISCPTSLWVSLSH